MDQPQPRPADDAPRPGLLAGAEAAAQRVRAAEQDLGEARAELVEKIKTARDEGIPFSLIARRVGLSRERVRQLYSGTALTLVALNGERIAHDAWRWWFHSPFN